MARGASGHVKRAEWAIADVSDFGRRLYESIPIDERPHWAGGVLAFVVEITKTDLQELKDVLSIGNDATRWSEAHAAFDAVRKRTLMNEKAGRNQSIEQLVLDIGETAAKIVYNASGAPAPFDYHAGWRLAPRVKALAERLENMRAEEECWRLLIRGASQEGAGG
jgi:hypothetical protein